MRETQITIPELALVAGTRVALGTGLGLLLANRLTEEQRKAVGWTLFGFGVLSTIPIAFEVLGGGRLSADAELPEGARHEWASESEEPMSQPAALAH